MLSFRNLNDMALTIAANLHRINREDFDVIVGIPRSGMIPAALLATHLQMPLADIHGFRKGIISGRSGVKINRPGNRVLLVDDSCNKGRAMERALNLLPVGIEATRLAVFGPYQVDPLSVCDIWFEVVHGPRVFAWNIQKHIRLPRWGFDFDGVFCRDPQKEENDDGERYCAFLEEAQPVFIPTRPIGHIVTCRLEKYRRHTTEWLQRHGIEFEYLHMMPYSTKAERMANGNRGGWKASVIKELGIELFIESCPKQAAIIARETGIQVFCTRTQTLA